MGSSDGSSNLRGNATHPVLWLRRERLLTLTPNLTLSSAEHRRLPSADRRHHQCGARAGTKRAQYDRQLRLKASRFTATCKLPVFNRILRKTTGFRSGGAGVPVAERPPRTGWKRSKCGFPRPRDERCPRSANAWAGPCPKDARCRCRKS
jgi:hypothetical protein